MSKRHKWPCGRCRQVRLMTNEQIQACATLHYGGLTVKMSGLCTVCLLRIKTVFPKGLTDES